MIAAGNLSLRFTLTQPDPGNNGVSGRGSTGNAYSSFRTAGAGPSYHKRYIVNVVQKNLINASHNQHCRYKEALGTNFCRERRSMKVAQEFARLSGVVLHGQ